MKLYSGKAMTSHVLKACQNAGLDMVYQTGMALMLNHVTGWESAEEFIVEMRRQNDLPAGEPGLMTTTDPCRDPAGDM